MGTYVGVFAHPDDEAFGPAGTIAKLAKKHDVFLICVTDGNAGQYLQTVRRRELRNSAKILGVKEVSFFNFPDGDLSNNLYPKVAARIKKKLQELKPETVITFELRGVSGHIDHVAVSMITTFVCQRLEFVNQIWYWCLTQPHRKLIGDYFIYFPPGYSGQDIDKVEDISDVWLQKIDAIKAHRSQEKDGKRVLEMLAKLPKEEHFQVLKLR